LTGDHSGAILYLEVEMTKSKMRAGIIEIFDTIEEAGDNSILDASELVDLLGAIGAFRLVVMDDDVTKEVLNTISWAISIGGLYAMIRQSNIVVVAVSNEHVAGSPPTDGDQVH
jgi:hypothetical protein